MAWLKLYSRLRAILRTALIILTISFRANNLLKYYKYVPAFVNNALKNPETISNGIKIISGNIMRRNFSFSVLNPYFPWTETDATQVIFE